MKKILGILVMVTFLISMMPLGFAAESEDVSVEARKSVMISATVRLVDYIDSAKERIASSSLEENEKQEIIGKLDEKKMIIKSYQVEISGVLSKDEVKEMKEKLKNEISQMKPIIEESTVKIHKDRISEITLKLKILLEKLEKIKMDLSEEDKDKVEKLESLIDKSKDSLQSAERMYEKNPKDVEEVKALLNEATKSIRECFSLIGEILSDMEDGLLFGNLDKANVEARKTSMVRIEEAYGSIDPSARRVNNVQNIYVSIGERFSLVEDQSAKLSPRDDGENGFVITVKDLSEGEAIIIINGGERQETIVQGDTIAFEEHTIELTQASENEAVFMLGYGEPDGEDEDESEDGEELTATLLPGETYRGVTLISVDLGGNSCVVEYEGVIEVINRGESRNVGDIEIEVKSVSRTRCALEIEE